MFAVRSVRHAVPIASLLRQRTMAQSAAMVHTEAHMKEIGITLPDYQGACKCTALSVC